MNKQQGRRQMHLRPYYEAQYNVTRLNKQKNVVKEKKRQERAAQKRVKGVS